MGKTIFVVEDDSDISRLMGHTLQMAGFSVRVFSSGDAALKAARNFVPDLFILDIMLPGEDGFDICREIRSSVELKWARVIFVSARTSEMDRVIGLELGGDDYITKPFGTREFVARVKAVLRRNDQPRAPEQLHFGELCIDVEGMAVRVRDRLVVTTTTEFKLLALLAQAPGRVVPRHVLLESVWGTLRDVDPRSVDVYVSRLRDKFESEGVPNCLRTIRGVGYAFQPPSGPDC